MTSVPSNVAVIPAINSNFSHHISAGLVDSTVITGQNSISHPTTLSHENPSEDGNGNGNGSRDQLVPESPATHSRNELTHHDHIEDANLPGSLPTLRKQYITFQKTHTADLPSRIERIWYINPYGQEIRPAPNPKVLRSIEEASTVIYSIGSLYTSIIPCLILRDVGEAIATSPNLRYKILILNGSLDRETRWTSPSGGKTNEFSAKEFIGAIADACSYSRNHNCPVGEEEWKEYVTHVIHLAGEGTPRVPKEELRALGIDTVRIYGRRVGSGVGEGMVYDGTALAQALEAVMGSPRRDLRGDKSRRNTLGVS
jgi:hypothetical protein